MRLKVQVVIESESGETEMVQEVAQLERHALRPESLGLTLSEAKALLQGVQKAMVTHQSTEYVTQHLACPECGRIRSQKGKHQIVFRTLFGKVRLDSPRLYHCGCCGNEAHRSLEASLKQRLYPGINTLHTDQFTKPCFHQPRDLAYRIPSENSVRIILAVDDGAAASAEIPPSNRYGD